MPVRHFNMISAIMPKVKVKEVEDEQQKILNLVKKMETEGQITINQSGDSTGDT